MLTANVNALYRYRYRYRYRHRYRYRYGYGYIDNMDIQCRFRYILLLITDK